MRRGGATAALLVLACFRPAAAPAEPAAGASYRLLMDGAGSQVTFELGALWHTVHGRGRAGDAELLYDPRTGTLEGSLVVAAGDLETGNRSRDRRMKSEVLESDRHPEITLRLRRAEGELDPVLGGVLQVEGELVLLGQAHPVSFPVEVHATDAEQGRIRATGAFMVPYVAWGLTDPSGVFLRVEKEVKVAFAMAGRMEATGPGAP